MPVAFIDAVSLVLLLLSVWLCIVSRACHGILQRMSTPLDVNALPDDVAQLKALLLQQHQLSEQHQQRYSEHTQRLENDNHYYKTQVQLLQEKINLLLHHRFGPSSEKGSQDQIQLLFNEAEQHTQDDDQAEPCALSDAHSSAVNPRRRARPGRNPLPEDLPRVEVIHDLTNGEQTCAHDGTPLQVIGREVSEQLDIIPAQIRVIRHVRLKYACPCCQQTMKTAPLPAHPIPKSMASAGLLAHIAVAKYADALPLYRQATQFERLGIDLHRATLSNWMVHCGECVQPLINVAWDALRESDYCQMDETRVQVLHEPDKAAQSPSFMWVARGGPPESPLILYDYDPTRSARVPERLLEGFSGYLQTDGYTGYGNVQGREAITAVGCFAHARRKFDEAIKAQGKKAKSAPKGSKASKGLHTIQRLYAIETLIKDKAVEERYRIRQEKAKPILEEMRVWLDKSLPQVTPQSALGKALHYLHKQWPKLIRYIDDGRLQIDNNRVENAIRPFALGRKNWLFSNTVKGAKASANLYSLIETAKANGLEPYGYLRHIFTELPKATSLEDIEALLPMNIDKEKLKLR